MVYYYVAPNFSTRERTGDIIIEGETFTVTQTGMKKR